MERFDSWLMREKPGLFSFRFLPTALREYKTISRTFIRLFGSEDRQCIGFDMLTSVIIRLSLKQRRSRGKRRGCGLFLYQTLLERLVRQQLRGLPQPLGKGGQVGGKRLMKKLVHCRVSLFR
jgi:hypothetical protein